MWNKQVPLLFLGDSPSTPSGLSRIGRDLVAVAVSMPEFRVGFLGRGGIASNKIPCMQYTFNEIEQWGETWLQWVWNDFAGDEKGVIMSIWDPSRLHWLANPVGMPNQLWLSRPPFQKWGYFPVDANGIGSKLTAIAADTVRCFDRVLAYGQFGSSVLSNSIGREVEWMPHGINLDTFQPRDAGGARAGFGIKEKAPLVGVVMTNQERKDWGLAFLVLDSLKKEFPGLRAWLKVDSVDRHWDLRALTKDFGLEDVVIVDLQDYTDKWLSYMYSACDVTFLPSLGEGFGYPIVESLACGVPVVHGEYAGGAELIQDIESLCRGMTLRIDTRYNCLRPVFNPREWVAKVANLLQQKESKEYYRAQVEHLDWKVLSIQWKKWFKRGFDELED